jgi:hypothetical protein
MATNDALIQLQATITKEARSAFDVLHSKAESEQLYGFALYTDDSALGLDAAVNSIEAVQRKLTSPRADSFAAYWYTIEWAYEGGVVDFFAASNELLAKLAPATNTESDYDQFRHNVYNSMIHAMQDLARSAYFEQFAKPAATVLQIAITDSDDDEHYMNESIRALNADTVYLDFIQQKEEAGH